MVQMGKTRCSVQLRRLAAVAAVREREVMSDIRDVGRTVEAVAEVHTEHSVVLVRLLRVLMRHRLVVNTTGIVVAVLGKQGNWG